MGFGTAESIEGNCAEGTVLSRLISVSFLACASSWASANLIVNGDFESGLAGWSYAPTPYAHHLMSASVVTLTPPVGTADKAFKINPGTDASQAGEENGGTVTQTLSLVGGVEYEVSIGSAIIHHASPLINMDGGTIRLYMGTDLLWSWGVSPVVSSAPLVQSFTGSYTPPSTGTYDLTVKFTRTSPSAYLNHYIDDVSVSAVPEPVALGFLLAGAPVLLTRRKRV